MGNRLIGLMQERALRRWSKAANDAAHLPLPELRERRLQARALRKQIDRLIYVADNRLALPSVGSTSFPRPHGTDWSWRPSIWRDALPTPGLSPVYTDTRIDTETAVFHDCPRSEISLRQLRNLGKQDLAPFGLRTEIFGFDGSFLSLAIDLPKAAHAGLNPSHLLRAELMIETEKPVRVTTRLNLQHGPNAEQICCELPADGTDTTVTFDLAFGDLNTNRICGLWFDLIFDCPVMNQITIRDLTFTRHVRAEI